MVEIHSSIVEIHKSIVKINKSMIEIHSSIVEIQKSMVEIQKSIVEIHKAMVEIYKSRFIGKSMVEKSNRKSRLQNVNLRRDHFMSGLVYIYIIKQL